MKVGVNVAIIHNEQVLLTKREDFEVWCLPGGHVDNGESVAQAAIREICVVWLQNVPFDPTTTRQELYDLRDKSGLSGHEFYAEYFGWDDTDEDKQEVG